MSGPLQALVIGEALVDIVHDRNGETVEAPGGSPLNVAVTSARLGVRTALLTALGDDERADLVCAHLDDSGVELASRARRLSRTSTATAVVQPDGSARYEFDFEWDPGPVELPAATVTHAGSLALFVEPGAELVRRALEDAATSSLVTLDPNVRPALLLDASGARAAFERLVPLARLVKLSDEDAAWLYPGMTELEVARHLLAAGPGVVALTRGDRGCLMRSGDVAVEVPAARTTLVDTIGAGDSFMGALVHQLVVGGLAARLCAGEGLASRELELMGRSAVSVAAVTVSRPGADPPWRTELATFVGGWRL